MRPVIVPSTLAWTFALLTPSTISFGLTGAVVGEFIGGESDGGLGIRQIETRMLRGRPEYQKR
ncbi:MAG: hypothetical protein HYR50_16330 [Candidatus Rokubacteria bacterium]|nr:hypothetical protein [Candidatus Rokubacteria bacterium]